MSAENPRYITQISNDWLNRVNKTVNAEGERFIRIEDRGEKKVITIDENQFKLAVYAILRETIRATGFTYVKPQSYDLDFNYIN